jgi:preprotein translocase subunit SecE
MNRIKHFFSEVSIEMKIGSWPKWDELKGSTWVVVSFSIIISAFLFFIDRILSTVMQVVL